MLISKIMEKSLKINIPERYEIDAEKSTFEKIVFKKIETKLPKTWEEFCDQNLVKKEYYITNRSSIIEALNSRIRDYNEDKNLLYTKEDAEAHLALIQLHRLRDVYRQGWVPDWNSNDIKYGIEFHYKDFYVYKFRYASKFLSFQSQEIAEEFFKNFKDLIEKAKDLI